MKLRLLLTEDCDRSCPGCCNKDWDLDALGVCDSFDGYSEVLITGGEPMLYPDRVLTLIRKIRRHNPATKIYVYTAKVDYTRAALEVLNAADGMTLTLHEPDDAKALSVFDFELKPPLAAGKSLRLNVFNGIETPELFNDWKTKEDMEWVKDCPLPEGEIFARAYPKEKA